MTVQRASGKVETRSDCFAVGPLSLAFAAWRDIWSVHFGRQAWSSSLETRPRHLLRLCSEGSTWRRSHGECVQLRGASWAGLQGVGSEQSIAVGCSWRALRVHTHERGGRSKSGQGEGVTL